jgi:hypothetical protein
VSSGQIFLFIEEQPQLEIEQGHDSQAHPAISRMKSVFSLSIFLTS